MHHAAPTESMIPAFAVMLAAYIIARMLEMMTRKDAPDVVQFWAVLTCLVAMGAAAYIFYLAQEAEQAIRSIGF